MKDARRSWEKKLWPTQMQKQELYSTQRQKQEPLPMPFEKQEPCPTQKKKILWRGTSIIRDGGADCGVGAHMRYGR